MKSTLANKEFPPSRRTRRSAGRWSDALKDPRIRRAVSTLVYATPLHPAQRHLPVNLHPPNSAPFFGQVGWQVHAGGGHAGADSTVKMTTHEAALLGPQKDTTTLWAAATFMFLEMPLNATAAHILVAAAAFVWRSSRKELACSSSASGDESFCTCLEHTWNLMMLCSLMRMASLVTLQPVLSGRAFFGACVCCRVSTRVVQTCAVTCS